MTTVLQPAYGDIVEVHYNDRIHGLAVVVEVPVVDRPATSLLVRFLDPKTVDQGLRRYSAYAINRGWYIMHFHVQRVLPADEVSDEASAAAVRLLMADDLLLDDC